MREIPKRGLAGDTQNSIRVCPEPQRTEQFIERHASGVLQPVFRRRKVINRPGEVSARALRLEVSAGNGQLVLLNDHRDVHRHVDGEVSAGCEMQRLYRKIAAVAGCEAVVLELRPQIFTSSVPGRSLRVHLEGSVPDGESTDGEIENRLNGILIKGTRNFGLRNVGGAIRINDDRGLGLFGPYFLNVDGSPEERDDFQLHRNRSNPQQRGSAWWLGPVNYKVAQPDGERIPVELERTDFNPAAGGFLRLGHDAPAHLFPQPVALSNEKAGDNQEDGHADRRSADNKPPPGAAGHRNASG